MFAISHLRRNLKLKEKMEIGRGLIMSKIEYCIESTSACPRTHMKGIRRTMNKTERLIMNE